MRYCALMVFLFFSFVSHAQNRSFYVDAVNGNDTRDGSLANPWKTVSKVNSFDFEPGDVLSFAGGQTFGQVNLQSNDDGLTVTSYNGVATLGSLYAYNVGNITIDNLKFLGFGTVNSLNGIKFYMDNLAPGDLNNITIKNTTVGNFGGSAISIGAWNTADGYNNVRVTDCNLYGSGYNGFISYGYNDLYNHTGLYISNVKAYQNYGRTDVTSTNTGSGIVVSGFDGGLVENSEAYGNGKNNRGIYGGPQGFWCYNSRAIIFQYNVSHDNNAGKKYDGGGFDIDGGSQDCIIQYNYSYNNDGAGYAFFEHSSTNQFNNNTIRYNISENDARRNAHGGIMTWASDTLNRVKNSYIYNNTIYISTSATATPGYPVGVYYNGWNTKNISFYNNIIYTLDTVKIWTGPTTTTTFSNNNYYTPGKSATFTKGGTWKDPLFKDAGSGKSGFVLRGTSPMIDAGKASPVTEDIIGTHVPTNNGYDIGAYESFLKPPVANAGADQTVSTADGATLSGSGTDADGTIEQYSWTKINGPTSFLINSPNSATTTVTNLVVGTYTFRLTVTDNDGISRTDDVLVYVKDAVAPGAKLVKVNLYGGTNPYNNSEWNNWNFVASTTFNGLKYWDGTSSTINAVVSSSYGTADNGSTYGGTMAPPEVLRYATYGVKRTLTLSGLSTSKTYNLELYASRGNTGNSTIFTIGATTITIVTDYNKTNKAAFTNIKTNSSGQIIVTIDKTGSYNYLNGFILTENGGNVEPNVAPTANAGPDKSMNLPTNATTLNGSGTDTDGSIVSYSWTKISGPSQFTIGSPGTASTSISNLVQGAYTFRLTVKDNDGATGYDDVQVLVNGEVFSGTRYVKVNVYGGTNPYNNAEWNNWNVVASKSVAALKYSDESSSSIGAVFSSSYGNLDNGSTYGGTMAPPEVLRYGSYGVLRTLTLSGLSTSNTYNLELYATRGSTGNSTIFKIGTTSITIVTDYNKTNKAIFTGLVPNSAGQIVITIDKIGTYNFVNGFILTESGSGAVTTRSDVNAGVVSENNDELQAQVSPNPAVGHFNIHINGKPELPVQLSVLDGLGRLMEIKRGISANATIPVGHSYKPGVYYAEIMQGNRKVTLKLVKGAAE